MKFFKKERPVIKFVSTVPGLEKIKDIQPVPAKEFYPKWWKDVPFHDKKSDVYTVKSCPAMPDYFSQGFILPMWADTKLEYDPQTTVYRWDTARPGLPYKWDIHPNSQFIDHVDEVSHQGSKGNFIFKAESPWKVITPKGYSLLQLPVFYHFNNQFSVLPGILRSDIHHEISQQVLVHGQGKVSIEIPRGTPLVHYIPIKREEFDLDIHLATNEEHYDFNAKWLDIMSSKIGNQRYRRNWND
jgi:hypothetical protein